MAAPNAEIQRGLESANELVDTVPGPVVILNGELRVEKANLAFYELFRTKAELANGRLLAELGARDWGKPSCWLSCAASSKVECRSRNGRSRWSFRALGCAPCR